MAAAVTIAAMVTSVRRRTNLERKFNFITDEELVEYLNYCLGELYDLLVETGGQEFYRKDWQIVTNTEDDTYPLPPDFYKLTSADIEFSNNVITNIYPYTEGERNIYQRMGGWTTGRPAWYRMIGKQIRFIPEPGGEYTVNLHGYPVFEKLTPSYTNNTKKVIASGPQAFDGVNGWEEYAVWKAVAYCQQKLDRDASFAQGRAQELDARIRTQAINRDMTGPERVEDVSGFEDWFS